MSATLNQSFASIYTRLENVWVPKSEAERFGYTDGDEVEERLAAAVEGATDVSLFSEDLRKAQIDWASRYHFSASRANLLRPLQAALRGNTLEIGAGCGAITRFLGESEGRVVALEGSSRRARIAASRCRGLSNVEVVNDTFDRFETAERFSAVTFIGVLEYARIYGEGEKPASRWLQKAYSLLEDDGVLIIAIENQLGLKYFAGLPEDHLAESMVGINDQYGEKTAVTYGRLELQQLLEGAGFESVEFALPFPDYKLPVAVVLPKGYDGSSDTFDAAALARQTVTADAQLYHPPLFSLARAWGLIERNGLLADLSNSFLVTARKRKGQPYLSTTLPDCLAFHYASERVPRFCKQNTFQIVGDAIQVKREPLTTQAGAVPPTFFSADIHSEAYIRGVNYGDRLEELLTKRGWRFEDVNTWLSHWLEVLSSALAAEGLVLKRELDEMVPGWTVDALPRNLIVNSQNESRFIDLEWRTRGSIEFGYVLYRSITVSLAPIAAVAMPDDPVWLSVSDLTLALMLASGVLVTSDDIARYLQMDGVLRKEALGKPETFDFATFSTFKLKVLPEIWGLVAQWGTSVDAMLQRQSRLDDDLRAAAASVQEHMNHIGALEEVVHKKDSEITDLQTDLEAEHEVAKSLVRKLEAMDEISSTKSNEIEAIYRSLSWRLTAPLRKLKSIVSSGRLGLRSAAGRFVRGSYRAVPVSTQSKLAAKNLTFKALGPVLGNTASYKAWEQHRARQNAEAAKESNSPASIPRSVPAHAQKAERADIYVPIDDQSIDWSELRARAIAFYLPQFHPIRENDEWWGRGFTEWTNVTKASPQFVGHDQPRLPGELGFYDLRLPEVMRRQVELARHYGVQGFCFHHYWFGGRRLLELPLNNFFADKEIDFPFCICWANENWTRRWDGNDQDLLIGQNHSPEDDLAFIESIVPLLRDSRYIRVGGRPLILVYRPSLLPDAKATAQRWRQHCREHGLGEIALAMVQFDVDDPRKFDFDVAVEFPPHKLARNLPARNSELEVFDPNYAGHVMAYTDIVERAKAASAVDYPMIRGVFPSWDNEARKPGRGYTFAHSTPAAYAAWLRYAVHYAEQNPVLGEKLVFINAWNEWAEGAYLEPDRRHGYAYLQATREALTAIDPDLTQAGGSSLLVVSHDAHAHGAQYLALHLAKELKTIFGHEVHVGLLGEGTLSSQFSEAGVVHELFDQEKWVGDADALAAMGIRTAICNTTVSGKFASCLRNAGISVLSLVHELPGVIVGNHLEEHAKALAEASDCVVFPADIVHRGFETFAPIAPDRTRILPQGCYKLNRYASAKGRVEARLQLRRRLAIRAASKIVLCVGYADLRKGIDLFAQIGGRVMERRQDVHFLWVGHFDLDMETKILETVRSAGLQSRFHFPGSDIDTDLYYAGSDVYALTSREDPFPSVVMESLQVGVPVVGFAGAGGFTELLEEGAGIVVPAADLGAFSEALLALLDDEARAETLGNCGKALIEGGHSFRSYTFDLLDLLGYRVPKISVIVPNYNYARYLPERIDSILKQSVPIYELIVLDDASTDGSIEAIEQLAVKRRIHMRVVRNAANSGSVFRQWAKGIDLARGEFVWIAEADDLSESGFLENLSKLMKDDSVAMAYCQSRQMDSDGQILVDTYLDYTNDVSTEKWSSSYREKGTDEARACLTIKNTIPNVSAVLFRRDLLKRVIDRDLDVMCSYKIAGDWVAYLGLMERGDIAFDPKSLNLHRRHQSSVTIGGDAKSHMLEILRVQRLAAERYSPDDVTLGKVEAYNKTLYQHFGLDEADKTYLEAQLARTVAS